MATQTGAINQSSFESRSVERQAQRVMIASASRSSHRYIYLRIQTVRIDRSDLEMGAILEDESRAPTAMIERSSTVIPIDRSIETSKISIGICKLCRSFHFHFHTGSPQSCVFCFSLDCRSPRIVLGVICCGRKANGPRQMRTPWYRSGSRSSSRYLALNTFPHFTFRTRALGASSSSTRKNNILLKQPRYRNLPSATYFALFVRLHDSLFCLCVVFTVIPNQANS